MMVRWTAAASDHLDAIFNYIARDSSGYAKRIVDRLTRRSLQISEHPFSGRKVPEYDSETVREVIEGSYRIIYRIGEDRVDVLAVLHGAMNVLSEPDRPK